MARVAQPKVRSGFPEFTRGRFALAASMHVSTMSGIGKTRVTLFRSQVRRFDLPLAKPDGKGEPGDTNH